MDGKKWNLIDKKSNRNDLVGAGYMKTFDAQYKGKYSYFRITQTGINSSGNKYFDLGKVEFFGTLYTKYSLKGTCYCRRKTSYLFMFMVILLTS